MNTFANAALDQATTTRTENGAVTYSTSLNAVVDMFFQIGAIRGQGYDRVKSLVAPAFKQDSELAFRVALWARDIKQGAGERQTFRHVLRFLLENSDRYGDYAGRSIEAILKLGRADDLFVLLDDKDLAPKVLNRIQYELENGNGLVAKWLPRKGLIAARVRKWMKLDAKAFRKLLVANTKVVETAMCEKNWDSINYSHVPSVAMARYMKAFSRNDGDRFGQYLNRVKTGEVNPETGKVEKINTGAVYPYDVIRSKDEKGRDVMWDKLPDYVPEGISFMPIVDTSGSMDAAANSGSWSYGGDHLSCYDVALSLGIYLAERNKGAFKDLWIDFSTTSKFNVLKGEGITEKVKNARKSRIVGSTNLEAAMKLVLNTAVKNKVHQEDLPKFLLVLSDMEFNPYSDQAPGEQIKKDFAAAGYEAPTIVWWNIQSRNGSTPVRANEEGMALVSGFSASIMQNLLSGEATPVGVMMQTILKDRYNF